MAKLLKVHLRDVDHCIGVSHTCRLNMASRYSLDLKQTSTIPNAIDPKNFMPDPSKRYPLNTINIVHISRLCYRKGSDLLIDIIPAICKKYPNVHWIIGGDGNKYAIIDKMRKEHNIEDRVEMLGFLRGTTAVRNALVRGHIFLNVSLTESFCIAILEAACAGLLVVTTDVGGIPEVLPEDMMYPAKPNSDDLIK